MNTVAKQLIGHGSEHMEDIAERQAALANRLAITLTMLITYMCVCVVCVVSVMSLV